MWIEEGIEFRREIRMNPFPDDLLKNAKIYSAWICMDDLI